MGAWIALVLLVIAGLALLLRADAGTIAGFDASDFAIAMASIAMLITWAIVALMLVAGYSYREEILSFGHRVAGELLPPGTALRGEPQINGERSVQIRRRPDGHFVARTQVNGVSLTMLVETRRCAAPRYRRRSTQVLGTGANGQWHHLCRPRAPA